MNVTLGLIFVASLRKEWPMTFIAVRCLHCQSDQIGPCTCTLRIITTGLPGRPSQGQKGLDERALMASQRPSHPW
jgi:hypothetical protein